MSLNNVEISLKLSRNLKARYFPTNCLSVLMYVRFENQERKHTNFRNQTRQIHIEELGGQKQLETKNFVEINGLWENRCPN